MKGKLGKMDHRTQVRLSNSTLPMPFSTPYDVSPDGQGNIWIGDDSNLNEGGGGPPSQRNPALMKFDTALVCDSTEANP